MKELYYALPVFAQNLACSWAGYRRFRDRFTPHFHEVLASWQSNLEGPESRLLEIQRDRLSELVERARKHVPHYKDLPPPSTASDPEQAIQETLAGIPILEKETYRSHTEDFISRDIPTTQLRRGVTAGTTGSALRLYSTPEALAEEYATVWRLRKSQGIDLRDVHLTWGGQVIVPFNQRRPPFWRQNAYGRQLLFSTYHMSPGNLEYYIDAILDSEAVYVTGYPSALHLMSRAMIASGKTLPRGQLKGVFTSSESLLAFQKKSISEAFGASIWERYGSSEFAVSMTSCREGSLHVDMEFCIVEVEPHEETEDFVRGELLVTGLANPATPFLRYRIGDVGTMSKHPCPCGRPGSVFLDIDGRVEDFVMTPDDRLIGRIDHIFKRLERIHEAQILQETKESIEVLFVPDDDFGEKDEEKLVMAIREHLGDEIGIDLTRVASIPREANGKFRAVKSEVARLEL